MNEAKNHIIGEIKVDEIGMGRINAISISKIRNKSASKKNCNENGIRDVFLGSNPHSNGEFFSRSMIFFFLKIDAKNITIIEIKK